MKKSFTIDIDFGFVALHLHKKLKIILLRHNTICKTQRIIMSDQDVPVGSDDELYQIEDDGNDEVNDSDEEYEEVPFEPIYPGLLVASEYLLMTVIGIGANADVWMAYSIKKKEYFALKIQKSEYVDDGRREVQIIRMINEYANKHPSEGIHCVKMLSSFIYQCVDETVDEDDDERIRMYVCSVYDLYACSINRLVDTGKYKYGLPIDVVKKMTRDILKGLVVLHDKLKIVHTDLKPHNVLLKGISDEMLNIINAFDAESLHNEIERITHEVSDPSALTDNIQTVCIDHIAPVVEFVRVYRKTNPRPDIEDPAEEEEDDEEPDHFYENSDTDPDEELINGESDDELDEAFADDNVNELDELGRAVTQQEIDPEKYPNERKQDVIDTLENLNYNGLRDLHTEIDVYDFTSLLNNRATSKDHATHLDDRYIFNPVTDITDFGNSWQYNTRTKKEIQDRRYRAIEVIMNIANGNRPCYTYKADIWSLGCMVFNMLTGFILFDVYEEPVNADLQHLFLIESFIGPIPNKMKKASLRCDYLFDKKRNYHIKNVKPFPKFSLENRLRDQFLFDEEEAKQIASFIRCCLTIDPNKRPSASALLSHPWLSATSN
jgi:serine/threonine-protein kinase SRPK3